MNPEKFPNKISTPEKHTENFTHKEGVDFLFDQNPKLVEIGSKEEYSKYVDTLFPESKVRNIHYHGSPNKIDKFLSPEDAEYAKQETTTTGVAGIYFTDKREIAQVYKDIQNPQSDTGHLYAVALNVKKPLIVGNHILDGQTDQGLGVSALWHIQKAALASIRNAGFDAIQAGEYATRTSPMGENTEIAIFNSDQVHILGTDSDINDFKNFVESEKSKSEGIFFEQGKKVGEIFKLNPDLEKAVSEALGMDADYQNITVKLGRNKENSLGKVQNINVYYKGELIIDSDNVESNKLFLVTKADGTSYVGDIYIPTELQGQGLGLKILQKTANTLDTKIIPTYLSTGGHTSPNAKKMWEKTGNEILPNHDAEKLYLKYLEANFPAYEKNIFWHGSKSKKIEGEIRMNERDSGWFGNGFYISAVPDYSLRWGDNLHPMIIPAGKYAEIKSIKNHLEFLGDAKTADTEAGGTNAWILDEHKYAEKFTETLKNMGDVGARIEMDGFKDAEVVIFDPSQIYILGSDLDIKKFKEFASGSK